MLFALELTHDWDALVPLAAAVIVAHGVTVLGLRRSILTEKVSRRGHHVTREYAIDPLEVLFVLSLEDVLGARRRHLEEETRRERVLPSHVLIAPWAKAVKRWRERVACSRACRLTRRG